MEMYLCNIVPSPHRRRCLRVRYNWDWPSPSQWLSDERIVVHDQKSHSTCHAEIPNSCCILPTNFRLGFRCTQVAYNCARDPSLLCTCRSHELIRAPKLCWRAWVRLRVLDKDKFRVAKTVSIFRLFLVGIDPKFLVEISYNLVCSYFYS